MRSRWTRWSGLRSEMSRPFFNTSIDELERAFDRKRNDQDFLQKLVDELSSRSTDRSKQLKARAVQALGTVRKATHSRTTDPRKEEDQARATSAETPSSRSQKAPDPAARGPMPPVTDAPAAILSAWTALEVLSPLPFGDQKTSPAVTSAQWHDSMRAAFHGKAAARRHVLARGSITSSCSARSGSRRPSPG